MINSRGILFGLVFVFLLISAASAGAEMIVETKSGRTFRLPLNSDQLKSIRFEDRTAAAPQPTPPPATRPPVVRPDGSAVINVWNKGGCSFTDTAEFQLSGQVAITGLITWRNWPAGENQTAYQLFKDGRLIYKGAFSRGNCDSNQTVWCEGISRLKGSLGPGRYAVKVPGGRVCRNQASGSGFIQVFSASGPPAGGGGQADQGGAALSNYTRTPNAAIAGHNYKRLNRVSVADCAQRCDKESWCVSFDYYKRESACDLSNKRAQDVGGLKTDYARDPYDHYSKTGFPGYSITPNAAISGHNRKLLQKVSPADCARACNNEPWCVSFDYYKGDAKCDLSDKRARDVGGLKTDYAGNPFDHYSKN